VATGDPAGTLVVVTVPDFSVAVQRAVDHGLDAAAILDDEGKPFAVAGGLDDDEVRAVEAVATRRLRTPDLLNRMLEGQMVTSSLDDREVSIGIAARCVFIAVVLGGDPARSRRLVDDLRRDVEQIIRVERSRAFVPRPPSGGSSSGPAELPVIELGVTVRRDRN